MAESLVEPFFLMVKSLSTFCRKFDRVGTSESSLLVLQNIGPGDVLWAARVHCNVSVLEREFIASVRSVWVLPSAFCQDRFRHLVNASLHRGCQNTFHHRGSNVWHFSLPTGYQLRVNRDYYWHFGIFFGAIGLLLRGYEFWFPEPSTYNIPESQG